jgi:hypothetical protein
MFAGRVTGSIGQTSPGATAGLSDMLSDPGVGRLAGDTAEGLVADGVAAEASDAPPVVVISAPRHPAVTKANDTTKTARIGCARNCLVAEPDNDLCDMVATPVGGTRRLIIRHRPEATRRLG